MPKFPVPALIAVGGLLLLWVLAPQVVGMVLLAAGFVFALTVAGVIVVALVDLAGPTRTDADGHVLGFTGRMAARWADVRRILGSRPWRPPTAVRAVALRRTAAQRVSRPGGPAAAEHIGVWMHPDTLASLDSYQHLDEMTWDLAENYRQATAGQPAASGMVTVWVFADHSVGRGQVRVRTTLREPDHPGLVAHASRPLDPARVLPRGHGARGAEVAPQVSAPAPGPREGSAATDPTTDTVDQTILAVPTTAAGVRAPGPTASGAAAAGPPTAGTTTVAGTASAGITAAWNPTVTPAAADTTIRLPVAPSPAPTPTRVLRIQVLDASGRPVGAPHTLSEGSTTVVGRSPDAGIRILEEHVSRSHLQLRVRAGRLYGLDLGSRAGTRLAGVRLAPEQEVEVIPGNHIDLAPQPGSNRPVAALAVTALLVG